MTCKYITIGTYSCNLNITVITICSCNYNGGCVKSTTELPNECPSVKNNTQCNWEDS